MDRDSAPTSDMSSTGASLGSHKITLSVSATRVTPEVTDPAQNSAWRPLRLGVTQFRRHCYMITDRGDMDPSPLTLATLGELIVEILRDEAEFLRPYESNWGDQLGMRYGLAGRREAHIVAAVASGLRVHRQVRSILDDDYQWGTGGKSPGRCDLAIQLSKRDAPGDWVWTEFKTMPRSDVNDKLKAVHDDIEKLDKAARASKENLPQALVVVGYGREDDDPSMQHLLHHLAFCHRLESWDYRLGDTGIKQIEIPRAPTDRKPFHSCVIGYWARESTKATSHGCPGRCHLEREAVNWSRR